MGNKYNAVIGQSGGPTCAINATLAGVINGCLDAECIDRVYGMKNGITGGSSGGGAKPFPVSPDEMESILRRMGQSDQKVVVDFNVGDTVRILAGPFSGMEGRVNAMNDQTQTASVLTMLFGRETPTDISYNDLQKVTD